MKGIFCPADILIPVGVDMEKWSVVACDQFTSEPEYWEKAVELIGDAPSTLRLMLPEAWLERPRNENAGERIAAEMDRYLSAGLFRELKQSMVYVERTQSDGRVRRGLVGAIDLEAYDYSSASTSPVRATEGTVESRLPPRVAVRSLAPLEIPHVMVLADDQEKLVIEALAGKKASMELLYDFDLMLGGGHLTGWLVSGDILAETNAALAELGSPEALKRRYGDVQHPMLFAMGDGNHSLATAKLCWERIRATLSPTELESCPARYGLVELVNVHDEAIDFEPIHRVLFDTDADVFLEEAAKYWEAHVGSGHTVGLVAGRESLHLDVSGFTIGQLIGAAEDFCQSFLEKHGGRIDYVHGTETAEELCRQPGCCAVLLPAMNKSELFPSVMRSGAFPRKSFSIGHAQDKRYYTECRRIR